MVVFRPLLNLSASLTLNAFATDVLSKSSSLSSTDSRQFSILSGLPAVRVRGLLVDYI